MTRDDAGFEGPIPAHVAEAVAKHELIFKDTFPGMLGVRILEAGASGARASLEVNERVRHPGGYAHGGAIAGFGDTVAAWATFPSLSPDETFTTIEFKTNFITGVTGGSLLAEAKVIHRGGRTMVVEVRIVTDEEQPRLVAIMIVTQAILRTNAASATA